MEKSALPKPPNRGTWLVVWLSLGAAVAASVAANVAHAPPEWGPRFASAWSPLALLLTVEVMMRVPAPRFWLLAVLRYLATIAVAVAAAVASYWHMYDLMVSYGEPEWVAWTFPLSVDGLALASSLGLLTLSDQRRAALAAYTVPPTVADPQPPAAAESDSAPAAADPNPAPEPAAEPKPVPPAVDLDPEPESLPPAVDESVPVADPLPLPLPTAPPFQLPNVPPIVPPLPWPRQGGNDDPGSEPLPVDLTPELARLDAETRQLYLRAYRHYFNAAAAGMALTGRELGAKCGRGERWGRDRIAECKAAQKRTAETKQPAAAGRGR